MNTPLDLLHECTDVGALRRAIQALCARFGSIRQLDIVDSGHRGASQVMCFLRMELPEQEHRLARELGIGRFGGELVLVVDLANRRPASLLPTSRLEGRSEQRASAAT